MKNAGAFQHTFRFPSRTSDGQRVQQVVLDQVSQLGYSERTIFGIKLALEEALVNAIKHGNQLDPSKEVRLSFSADDRELLVEIEDEGPGFVPADVPDPTDPENLERPCGRGLFLMRAYMTECDFVPPGNICRMRRVRE